MHSAIGSRKDFNNLDEDQLLAEYKVCLEGQMCIRDRPKECTDRHKLTSK